MKTPFTPIAVGIAAVFFHATTFAQETRVRDPFEGTWRWTFTMPDGAEVKPSLKINRDSQAFVGTTRFRAGDWTPGTNLIVQGDELKFDVIRERDGERVVTQYSGKRVADEIKGKITSNWTGRNESYDWQAKHVDEVDGTWRWPVTFGDRTFDQSVTLTLKGDKLSGKMAGRRGGRDTDIKNGTFKDGKVSFDVERDRDGEKTITKYRGKLAGDNIT